MLAAALLSALAVQASGSPKGGVDSFDLAMGGKSPAAVKLAEAMDRGFHACGRQLATRKHLAGTNAAALKKAGIVLSSKPPADVAAAAATVFKKDPIFAQVTGAAASVWIVGSTSIPVCRVMVGESADVPNARKELAARFAAAKSWSPDPAQSHSKDGVLRQAYVLNPGKPGPRLLTFIDGPGETTDGGKGIQAIITVGVAKGTTAGATQAEKK